jgi:hypothetical protein
MRRQPSAGAQSHPVDTVKVGDKGQPRGSGKVTFQPAERGGTFTVDATAEGRKDHRNDQV